MKFSHPNLRDELKRAHPELRAALAELDSWSKANSLPEIVLTDVARTVKDQIRLYKKSFKDKGYTEAQAASLASKKFSWHLKLTAADIRTNIYSPKQLEKVIAHVNALYAGKSRYELITKLHGTGPHIHLAIRDHSYKPEEAQWS